MTAELLGNATVLTLGKPCHVIGTGAVLIEDGLIRDVGSTGTLRHAHSQATFIDLHGDLLMPGLISAHSHFCSALGRGALVAGTWPDGVEASRERLWWPLQDFLTLKAVQTSAQAALCEAIRSGCTTVVDLHASPRDVDGSLDVLAEATTQAGVRACLAYEVSDRHGPNITAESLAENQRFIQTCRRARNSLLAASFGLDAAVRLSDQTLRAAAERSDGAVWHLHLGEEPADTGAVDRLAEAGMLGPKTLAAQCIHPTDQERKRMLAADVNVVHSARSNLSSGAGLPPLLSATGLGSDGFNMNMFEEMKFACLARSGCPGANPADRAAEAVQMVSQNNAAIVRRLFEPFLDDPLRVGEIAPGAAADLIVLDYRPPTPLTAANLPWHLIAGIDAGHVTSTIVAGRWLMKDRELLTLDEEEIAAASREQSAKLWKRIQRGA